MSEFRSSGLPVAEVLYWGGYTARVPFETGIQRVVRHLRQGLQHLGVSVADVSWNLNHRRISFPTTGADSSLKAHADGTRVFDRATWVLIPEIPLDLVTEGLDPVQLGHAYGLKTAAIVHDMIPLKFKSDYSDDVVSLYRRYFQMFAEADLVFATTRYVAADLTAYLGEEGLRIPTIAVCPLPAQFAGTPRLRSDPPSRDCGLRFLAICTWEPRKNLIGLLRAFRACSSDDRRLSLTVVGRRAGWPRLDEEIDALAAELANVRLYDSLTDRELLDLCDSHHATIYPSCEEGFGLPILESLWLGRPCICHNASSMAEVAPGGGTLMIDMTDEATIAKTLDQLMEEPNLLLRLHAEAIARPLATWAEFAATVASHMGPVHTPLD